MDLIKGCIKKDKASQKRLYDTYSGKLMAICKRYLSDDILAKDILIKAFIQIYNNIKNYKNNNSFENWMRNIVINTAIDNLNNDKNIFQSYEEIEDDEYILPQSAEDLSINELISMIRELPIACRIAFNMFVIDEFSYNDISKRFGVSEEISKWHVNKARKLLQEKFNNYDINTKINK